MVDDVLDERDALRQGQHACLGHAHAAGVGCEATDQLVVLGGLVIGTMHQHDRRARHGSRFPL